MDSPSSSPSLTLSPVSGLTTPPFSHHPSTLSFGFGPLRHPSEMPSDVMVPQIRLSGSLDSRLDPEAAQLALDSRPHSAGDIISPKSTFTVAPLPHPAESLGRTRSLVIQRDHLRPWLQATQLSLPQPIQPFSGKQTTAKNSDTAVRPTFADYVITSSPPSHFVSGAPAEEEVDFLAQSFGNSTSLDQTAWEPVQSFKKLVKRPLFSSRRSSVNRSSLTDSCSSIASASGYKPDEPSKRLGGRMTDEEILAEFQAPSHSIEEENRKMELLRVKRAQLDVAHSPLLTIEGELVSRWDAEDDLAPIVSRKRKASSTIEETEAVVTRTKVARHSPYDRLAYLPKVDAPIPSMAELQATMPMSSRLIQPSDPPYSWGTASCGVLLGSSPKDPSQYLT